MSLGLLSFETCFEEVEDPRVQGRTTYPLHTILFIAMAATVCGADGPEDMEEFARSKRAWLKQFIDLSHGIPSHDTLGRVLGMIKPKQFQDAFLRWLEELSNIADSDGRSVFVAIDGKTMRGSYDQVDKSDMLHIVSAWATQQGVTLGQVAVDDKSNEVTAIPELLEMLELTGAIVSIDAMGCQRAIASKIVRGGGDYVLQVKKNQKSLHAAIESAFEDADNNRRRYKMKQRKTKDRSRGRDEARQYNVMPIPKSFPQSDLWRNLACIGRVQRTVEQGENLRTETSYYISSLAPDTELFITGVRGHWSIENSLHWVMDVVFNEDKTRHRKDHRAENISFLRRFVISLLKQDTYKASMKQKRKKAGWNTEFLEKLLFQNAF